MDTPPPKKKKRVNIVYSLGTKAGCNKMWVLQPRVQFLGEEVLENDEEGRGCVTTPVNGASSFRQDFSHSRDFKL